MEQVCRDHPDAEVTVWAEIVTQRHNYDEHRIGLQPAPKGHVPMAVVQPRYQWLWLVGFVEPASGETYWWVVPKLNWRVMNLLLADFAVGLSHWMTLKRQR